MSGLPASYSRTGSAIPSTTMPSDAVQNAVENRYRQLAGSQIVEENTARHSLPNEEVLMRRLFVLIVALAAGLAVESSQAQTRNAGIVGLNHVALSVPNLDDAVTFYTKTMGFPEAFRSKDDKGQTTLVYVQISRDTFVE